MRGKFITFIIHMMRFNLLDLIIITKKNTILISLTMDRDCETRHTCMHVGQQLYRNCIRLLISGYVMIRKRIDVTACPDIHY